MNKIYNSQELLFLGEKAMSFKDKVVSITKVNGEVIKGKITTIQVSPEFKEGCVSPSHLPAGFILDDGSTISLDSIKTMEVCD